MNGIVDLVGADVIIIAVLSFFGLRWLVKRNRRL